MQSMGEIYQSYAKTVYKYLFSLTHSQDIAEELTQETFYQAVRSIDRFDGSCAVSTWLCAIAKHQLSSYRRKHPPTEHVEELDGASDSVEDKALAAAGRVDLLKRLHQCPEPFREIPCRAGDHTGSRRQSYPLGKRKSYFCGDLRRVSDAPPLCRGYEQKRCKRQCAEHVILSRTVYKHAANGDRALRLDDDAF